MDEYISRKNIQKQIEIITNDLTCPLHIAAEIDQCIALEPAADVVVRSELVKEIFTDFERFIEENKKGQYSPHGNYMGQCVSLGLFRDAFAELKKKYVQEDTLDARLSAASERSRETADNARLIEVFEKE